ncbi:hypothetical protein, partial [Planomonospora algeriensis]
EVRLPPRDGDGDGDGAAGADRVLRADLAVDGSDVLVTLDGVRRRYAAPATATPSGSAGRGAPGR